MNINGNSSGRQHIRPQPVIWTNNFGALFTDSIKYNRELSDSMKSPHSNLETGNIYFFLQKHGLLTLSSICTYDKVKDVAAWYFLLLKWKCKTVQWIF
jgi:hypothetical protein